MNKPPHIRSEFTVHLLNQDGIDSARILAEKFSELLDHVEMLGVSHRELALVKTKLEEAAFFAKRGIAMIPGNQIVTPPAPGTSSAEPPAPAKS